MKNSFQEIRDDEINVALEEILLPRLLDILANRARGHCMRVADLSLELMTSLCLRLKQGQPDIQAFILRGDQSGFVGQTDIHISSTKLVEFRNPLPDGSLRSPLLIFVPPNLRVSAEDSFGVATFEEIIFENIYEQLCQVLLDRIPGVLREYIQRNVLEYLVGESWAWADSVSRARYLLTLLKNGGDAEAAGASLFTLGLIPDFVVFQTEAVLQNRIKKNLDVVRKLTYSDLSARGRVLSLGLSDKSLQRSVMQLLTETGVSDPKDWTRIIVTDNRNWGLSFHNWHFTDEVIRSEVLVRVLSLDLPVAEDEENPALQDVIGQMVLAPKERRKFNVVFDVEPHPSQITGLDHFSVQVLRKDPITNASVSIGLTKKVNVWKSKKNSCTVALDKLNKVDFEEGWYFVRVLPWTAEEDPIPLVPSKQDLDDEVAASPQNESDLFFVLPDEKDIEETPPQRAIQKAESLEHARLRLQFVALGQQQNPANVKPDKVFWFEKSGSSHRSPVETLRAKFGSHGTLQISVTKQLKELEQTILASPKQSGSWLMPIVRGQVQKPQIETQEWPKSAAADSFFAARENYFAAVVGSGNLVTQAVDFLSIKDVCIAYASAYRDLLSDMRGKIERGSLTNNPLSAALAIDSILVKITDFNGKTREAVLLSPTHPLKVLWFAAWAQLGQHWISSVGNNQTNAFGELRDALLNELIPLNFPVAIPLISGRVFTAVDNVNPFWSLYAPTNEEDTRGLLGDICEALDLQEPALSGSAITSSNIASRVQRYLIQHPYVKTLRINVFNPGRATPIADLLLAIQKNKSFSDLRYDVRLFVPDPDAPGVGESIEELLSPGSTVSSDAADAFAKSTGSHLFPKLTLSIGATSTFLKEPDSYHAHISILFDLFPAAEIGSGPILCSENTIPVYGLIQDFDTEFTDDDETGTYWKRQPMHGQADSFPEADELTDLLANLPTLMSGAIATVATGVTSFEQRPIFTVGLSASQRQLIHHVHEASDWVFTIDRNMGIEFYDHGRRRDRPDYLIDYIPSITSNIGHRLIITTRLHSEIEALLRPTLERFGIRATDHQGIVILDQLRSLSGRLALKFISSPTQQAEVIGLALARLLLADQSILSNRVVVPIDDCIHLFRTAEKQAEELNETTSRNRTDLALFEFEPDKRLIRCNLVEVKYRDLGSLSAYLQIKEQEIPKQIDQTEQVLRSHFDAQLKTPDRTDRLLKTHEFSLLLRFYFERAVRYRLIKNRDLQDQIRVFLLDLETGYTLEFTRNAFIFDYNYNGADIVESENGIRFYKIGASTIRTLVSDAEETLGSDELMEPRIPPTHAPIVVFDREKIQPPPPVVDADERSENADEGNEVANEQNELELVDPEARIDRENDAPQEEVKLESGDQSIPDYDVILGVNAESPQYGILGEVGGRKLALDLNQTHTISLFGVQGSGKSYTLGSIIEMACQPISGLNLLPRPLATVVFHYSQTLDYKPEFTTMISPNDVADQVSRLKERYGVSPAGLHDIVLLAPDAKVAERKIEYPDINVLPIKFASSELKAMHWRFLMGAVGNQSVYLRQMNLIMRKLRDNLSLYALRQNIEDSNLPDKLKELALLRLQFAAEYIDDDYRLSSIIHPGRLIIVDLRDEFIEKGEALGLFLVMLQIFSEVTLNDEPFNKLVVFDEAHKYIDDPDLIEGLVEVVREMRHKGTNILVASQEPRSVPVSLIELSTEIILHRFNSPEWLRHIQKANTALGSLTPEKMSQVSSGEAYIWTSRSNEEQFTRGAVKIKCRPRVTLHGGGTKTAVVEQNI